MKSLKLAGKIELSISKRSKHWNAAEYQYWQRSKIPTMHFQRSLPRLPIPELNKSCDRYLLALKPLLDDNSFNTTQHNIETFKTSVGNTLQKLLCDTDKKNNHTSYISEPWFDMYLKDRKPLPINYNPVLVFMNDDKALYNSQLLRASNLIISSLRFRKSLDDGILEPEVFHMDAKKSDTPLFRSICSKIPSSLSWYAAYLFNAYALDMSQYHNLFNSTRIPKIDKDVIYSNHKAKHILVQHNGHFYTFNVLDDNGYILTPESILRNLQVIIDGNIAQNQFPLGVLTTSNRNDWAALRSHLEGLGNQNALNLIDSALFNVCLDNSLVNEDPFKICRTFLHGDGKDRWFDKSISLIISKDGVAGINFEHSWGDGVAVLRYFQDIHKDSTTNAQIHPDTKIQPGETSVSKLDINLDDKLKSAITKAINDYETRCDTMDVNVLLFDKLGKNLCKKLRVSPDSVMQLGFQVAYHKLTQKFAGTYESCSTAAFKHGRTETVRPCTMATKAFTMAVNSSHQPSKSELQHLMLECSKVHGQLTKEAAMGQGFDRHLYALRTLAEANDMKKPSLFADPAYETLNYNILSTSTLSSPSVWVGGFGPVVNDGYGIAYSMRDDSLGVLITSYKSQSNAADFTEALKLAYQDILQVLDQ